MELLDRLAGWGRREHTGQRQTSGAYSTLPGAPTDILPVEGGRSVDDCSDDAYTPELVSQAPGLSLSRSLADFTLGFADGLTVPFALTAGLSSLGHTNTVIYAGMAEICAGCISMGIGGYLAAKGEERCDTKKDGYDLRSDHGDDCEKPASQPGDRRQDFDDYLAALRLPSDLLQGVLAHIESSPEIAKRLRTNLYLARNKPVIEPRKTSPLISGFFVSLGYLFGGLLPLAPYFFVSNVNSGVLWSFIVCILALFIFGFSKEYALHSRASSHRWDSEGAKPRLFQWDRIKDGLWEGIRMVFFGGIAAVAAVLCVRLFEGFMS
ncbi:Ccc1 family [Xylariaceae sp. FL1651]|nr:Ccc1 family [Xylariaceae sp. FL1651]